MSPGPLRAFGLLAADAVRDALRRRAVLVVAFLALLVVSGLDRCVGGGVFRLDDRVIDPAPYLAPGLFALLAGGVILLAVVLAADHLARPVEEGTASLWLARPVGRATYAAARLAGVVGIAWGAGGVVLGTAALLMHARNGLPLGPALRGGLGCALGALVVAALSMAVSLWLPRLAALLVMLALVPWIFVLNGLTLAGVEFEGPLNRSLQHLGPPLLTVILNGVMAWTPGLTLPEGGPEALVRLAVWAAIGVALLVAAFHRTEVGR